MIKRKWIRRFLWSLLAVFLAMNVIAYMHAWKFTHFSNTTNQRTEKEKLTSWDKIKILFTGVDNPRPQNKRIPSLPYLTVNIKADVNLECWLIKAENSKGTVILFHGYGGEKSGMLDKAEAFHAMGYSVLLVDFGGSGGSEGNKTTIGYGEADEVFACYQYVLAQGEKNLVLFGTSMGAAAIMKSINDHHIHPSCIIIECPFGTMYQTVCNRFRSMHVPVFPMAGLLVFWGGVQNGFPAFSHNPEDYAKQIDCPSLIFYGEQDEKVSRKEINTIYENLRGEKQLITFPKAAHEDYLTKYKKEWIESSSWFMSKHSKQ